MIKKPCEIYYFSDMEKCVKCGLCWDANDPYPPKCGFDKPAKVTLIDKLIAFVFGDRQK